MDFQLILYIIIVIVWLVLDNFRRIKKKQEQSSKPYTRQETRPETEDRPYTSLEDILREFGMEEEPEVIEKPRPAVKKQKAKQPVTQTQSYNTYESSINKDYKFSSEIHSRGFQPSVIEKTDIKRNEIADRDVELRRGRKIDFDLRKAVIWSEILKRPYT